MEQQSKGVAYQQEFDFDTPAEWACPHGGVKGGIPGAKPARERQMFEAWKESTDPGDRLLEEIANRWVLEAAYQKVRGNKGAPGIDGMTVGELGVWLRAHGEELRRELLEGRYRPEKVKGVDIPKPNGGVRRLGIPTVKDRLVQQAIVLVLTPMLDPQMSESSYGFRPGRKAHDALHAGSRYVKEEKRSVAVDLDLEKFFDKVNHDVLMERLARRIKDKRLLYYIRLMLEAGMMDTEGVSIKREQGTPQGGPLSPLLANILLDELDKELEKRGHRFCRYADDCMIFVRTLAAGRRVLASITRYIEGTLKLKVNREKSKVAFVWECTYLGYIIGAKGLLRVAEASVEKLKAKVRLIVRRNRPTPIGKVVEELNPVLRGWANYFKCAAARNKVGRLDEWVRRKLRCMRLRQCKHGHGVKKLLEALKSERTIQWVGRRWWALSDDQIVHETMSKNWFKRELELFEMQPAFKTS